MTTLTTLTTLPDISTLRSRVDRVAGYHDSLKVRHQTIEKEITSLESDEEVLGLVVNLLRTLIDNEVNAGVAAIERLQTEALQSVFPDQNNTVKSEVEVKRGKVNVKLITVREYENGMVVEGAANEAFGGAISTVQSVLLRVTVILKRGMRPFIVLDESLPAIEGAYVLRMAKFLSVLCKRTGMDILLVTHDPLLVEAADKAYRIHHKNGAAYFKELRS